MTSQLFSEARKEELNESRKLEKIADMVLGTTHYHRISEWGEWWVNDGDDFVES